VAGKNTTEFSFEPMTYSEMRAGCYDPVARLEDMDTDGVVASLCFSSYSGFAGVRFVRGKDKELALLCVQVYNDWMIDEWCGAAPGRYIPLCMLPMWDVKLATAELERVAAKGAKAIAFNENPTRLGLPSIHDAGHYWDPVFEAATAADLPLCLHLGSSSSMAATVTAPDAPGAVMVALSPITCQIACFDWLLSDNFVRHPQLKIALSEGGIGWVPYALERLDYTWERQRHWSDLKLEKKPSEYFRDHIYGCFIDDKHGIANLDIIGVDNCMIESDYPHSDSTWPNTQKLAAERLAHLDAETQYKICRGNAERLFHFTPSGLGQR
jgi:predicted TIM-barrel fold metal-dependent hydrolase